MPIYKTFIVYIFSDIAILSSPFSVPSLHIHSTKLFLSVLLIMFSSGNYTMITGRSRYGWPFVRWLSWIWTYYTIFLQVSGRDPKNQGFFGFASLVKSPNDHLLVQAWQMLLRHMTLPLHILYHKACENNIIFACFILLFTFPLLSVMKVILSQGNKPA